MAGFNWVDFILILLLLVGMAIGYAQGILREFVGLIAIYIGLVVATQFFVPLSQTFSSVTKNPPNTLGNAIAFFIILFVVMSIINFIAKDAYRAMRIRTLPGIDHLGGMILGVISMWILVTVFVNVMTFAMTTQAWGSAEGYRLILEAGLTNSRVAELTTSTLPVIVMTIRPWMPGGLPAIFEL